MIDPATQATWTGHRARWLTVAFALSGMLTSTLEAERSLRLFTRPIDPESLVVGARREIPIIIQEQRDAEDVSVFDPNGEGACFGSGVAGLNGAGGWITSQQSTIIDFVPDERWIHQWEGLNSVRPDRASFSLATYVSDANGVQRVAPPFPVEVDNVGIVGVTEIEIGRLVIEVGPPLENRKLLQPHYDSHLQLDFDFRTLQFRCDVEEFNLANSGTLDDSSFDVRTPVANSDIRNITPAEGNYAGGYDIVIEGRQLVGGTRVLFDGVEAQAVQIDTDSPDPYAGFQRMVVTVPRAPRTFFGDQAVDVQFEFPESIGTRDRTLRDAFTYTGAPVTNNADITGDGLITGSDVDRLTVFVGLPLIEYDFNGDGEVDSRDRDFWVSEMAETWFGDSNLDGEFNSTDLINVFSFGAYEKRPTNAGWGQGDWDGDFFFDSGDLVKAFRDGGYEQGPRAATAAPEPSTRLLLLLAMFAGVVACRHRTASTR